VILHGMPLGSKASGKGCALMDSGQKFGGLSTQLRQGASSDIQKHLASLTMQTRTMAPEQGAHIIR